MVIFKVDCHNCGQQPEVAAASSDTAAVCYPDGRSELRFRCHLCHTIGFVNLPEAILDQVLVNGVTLVPIEVHLDDSDVVPGLPPPTAEDVERFAHAVAQVTCVDDLLGA